MSEDTISYLNSVQYVVDKAHEGKEYDQSLLQHHGAAGLEDIKNFRNIYILVTRVKNGRPTKYEIHYKMPDIGNAVVVKAVIEKDVFEKFLRLKLSNVRNDMRINTFGADPNTTEIVQTWLDKIQNPEKKPVFLHFRNDSYRTYHVAQCNQMGGFTFTRQMRNYSEPRVYAGEDHSTFETNIFAVVPPEENKELSDYEVDVFNKTGSRDITADQGCWFAFANALVNAHPELTESRGFYVSIQERV